MHIPDGTAHSTAGDVTRRSNGSCVHIPDGTAHSTGGDVTRRSNSSCVNIPDGTAHSPVCTYLMGHRALH